MVKPVNRNNIIGKYVEFTDKRRGDCRYMIGKVKKVTGKRKIWVSVRLPAKSKNRRIPFHWIRGTITKSGLRRPIEW